MLRAFAQVYVHHPDARLVLIGDGPARQSLEALAAELGITERVLFTGSLPFTDVPKYLRAADLFSFASVTETQGLVTMEAMAAGLPVVAVDATGTHDIVEHGQHGFLVENDPVALADGIRKMLSDPRQMKRFASRVLKKSREFDIDQQAKQLVGVYEQAIRAKQEGRSVVLREKTKEAEEVYQSRN
ncbi:MAG: glycosyltransferase [Chloroflexota bacterium]